MTSYLTSIDTGIGGREVILVSVPETGLPDIAQTAGSDHHFSICCPNSDYFLTDGWALYLLWEIEPMHLSVEGLRP